jgi:hypothetical protein
LDQSDHQLEIRFLKDGKAGRVNVTIYAEDWTNTTLVGSKLIYQAQKHRPDKNLKAWTVVRQPQVGWCHYVVEKFPVVYVGKQEESSVIGLPFLELQRDCQAHVKGLMAEQKHRKALREEVVEAQRVYREYEVMEKDLKEATKLTLSGVIEMARLEQEDEEDREEVEVMKSIQEMFQGMLENAQQEMSESVLGNRETRVARACCCDDRNGIHARLRTDPTFRVGI